MLFYVNQLQAKKKKIDVARLHGLQMETLSKSKRVTVSNMKEVLQDDGQDAPSMKINHGASSSNAACNENATTPMIKKINNGASSTNAACNKNTTAPKMNGASTTKVAFPAIPKYGMYL